MKGVTVHWLDEVIDCAEAWLTEEPALALRGFDGQLGYRTLAGLRREAVASIRVLAGPGTLLPYLSASVDELVDFAFAASDTGRIEILRREEKTRAIGVHYEPATGCWQTESGRALNHPLFGALPFPAPPLGPRSRLSTLAAV